MARGPFSLHKHLTPPRRRHQGRHVARKDNILQGINGGAWTPAYPNQTSGQGPGPPMVQTGPPDRSRTSLCRVRATLNRVPGFWDKEYPCLNQGQTGVRGRHVSGPCHVHFRSPLRRRPDAATWHIARDVSQRAEPNVRPLGHAVSTFIAEKTRRLTIPLTGDVTPQHLMCPVHSAGRRRPGHPAGGVPVQSIAKQYTCAARCTVIIITCTSPGRLPLHAKTTQIADIRVQEGCSGNECQLLQVLHPLCPWARMSGLSTLVRAPFSYKRGGTQRYNTSSDKLI
jgi:hypothetical protein